MYMYIYFISISYTRLVKLLFTVYAQLVMRDYMWHASVELATHSNWHKQPQKRNHQSALQNTTHIHCSNNLAVVCVSCPRARIRRKVACYLYQSRNLSCSLQARPCPPKRSWVAWTRALASLQHAHQISLSALCNNRALTFLLPMTADADHS